MAEILRDLPLEAYHDPASGWISHSKLHAFVEHGPRYFQQMFLLGTLSREETSALSFGQAFEDLVQRGGDHFKERWSVMPQHFKDGRSKAAQEWKAGQLAAGRGVISWDDYQHMLHMVDELHGCKKIAALSEGAEQQVTLRGVIHGVKMQARPDYVLLDHFGAHSGDIKTTKDYGDIYPYGYAVTRFGYAVQAAIVRHLLAQNGYENASAYLFVVEKKPTYRRACIEFLPRDLERAEAHLREWCPKLKECLDTDTWPNGPEEIVHLQPRWARDESQEAAP